MVVTSRPRDQAGLRIGTATPHPRGRPTDLNPGTRTTLPWARRRANQQITVLTISWTVSLFIGHDRLNQQTPITTLDVNVNSPFTYGQTVNTPIECADSSVVDLLTSVYEAAIREYLWQLQLRFNRSHTSPYPDPLPSTAGQSSAVQKPDIALSSVDKGKARATDHISPTSITPIENDGERPSSLIASDRRFTHHDRVAVEKTAYGREQWDASPTSGKSRFTWLI